MSPIRPENRHRYPDNWKEIRQGILERAGDRCEWCGRPNRRRILVAGRGDDTMWYDQDRGVWRNISGQERDRGPGVSTRRPVDVVLTIAHLDHTPENNADRNLRALCQQCHNSYDAPHRAENRRRRMEAGG